MIDRTRRIFDDAPVEHPLCPAHCCFRTACNLNTQERAVRDVWSAYQPREACDQFTTFAALVERDYGIDPPPDSVDEIYEIMRERWAIRDEANAHYEAKRAAAEASEREEIERIQARCATIPERTHGHGLKTDVGTSRPASGVRPATDTVDPFAEQLSREVDRMRRDQVARERTKREKTTGQQELVL